MKLYTCQLSQWRKATELGVPLLDVTIKSGEKLLAPEWGFLMKYKQDKDELAYTYKFLAKMRESFSNNKKYWMDLINKESICLACYCKSHKFCHRLLLVDIIEKLCNFYEIPFEYMGEL